MTETLAALGQHAWNSQAETFACMNELAQNNETEMEKKTLYF